MLIALTRPVSLSISRCELTHMTRQSIDLEKARRQHHAYEAALASVGVEVRPLPELADQPDAVFVEDTAVVLDECAVIARPGAESRRGETESVSQALAGYRTLFHIQAPATLDGGDLLCLGRDLYVGLSRRSNQAAVEQMRVVLAPYGFIVPGVDFAACLHLKSAVTQIAADILLINPAWVDRTCFSRANFIEVDPSEPNAANALLVNSTVLYQPAFPKTLRRLEAAGIMPLLVDMSELAKAEGALTCCSLIFR